MQAAPLASAFERQPGAYRRPLVLLSYGLQARLGGAGAPALHAFNVGVHAVNAALLAWLALRLGAGAYVAAAGASLFAAHPLSAGAVAYVSGRTDLLAALFTLLALHATAGASRPGMPGTAPRLRASTLAQAARCIAVAACVACAVASKESGLLAGPLVAAMWWMQRRDAKRAASNAGAPSPWPTLAAVATSLVMLVYAAPPALGASLELPVAVRLRAVGAAFTAFARLIVVPSDLHLDRLASVGATLHLAAGALALVAAAAVTARFAARPTIGRFAAASAALLSLPALNVVPVYPAIARQWVFAGEQLAYLPLAPLCLLGAAALERCTALAAGRSGAGRPAAASRSAAIVAVAAVAAIVAAWTPALLAAQSALSDAEGTYRRTLAHSPSPRACFNLGNAVLARGAASEAAQVYERCAAISPNDAGVYVQLGASWQRAGDRNKAELAYAKALALDPRDPYAWSNYASLEASAGLYEDARAKWERALEVAPGFAPALAGLAKLRTVSAPAPALPPPS